MQIYTNEQRIEQVKDTVFLGVVLDEHLSWRPHISRVDPKICRPIGIIYIKEHFFYLKALKNSLLLFSLSLFHYCIIVWGSTYETNRRRLVSLQKRVKGTGSR